MGFEPTTVHIRLRCSNHWATENSSGEQSSMWARIIFAGWVISPPPQHQPREPGAVPVMPLPLDQSGKVEPTMSAIISWDAFYEA